MAPEMQTWSFPDGNVASIVEDRQIGSRQDMKRRLKEHSSLIQRLILDTEMEGHQGCVNAIAWNAKGSLLISGSDDTRINIWSYNDRGLLHSIETGHNANIFCTKFVPETSDELVVSGAGDAEVRIFSLSHSNSRSAEAPLEPVASYKCHTRRVKKLAVEPGNPNVIWSASEDGTLRQHDLREVSSCPSGSSNHECHNVLLDLRRGSKKSLADPPKYCLPLKSCDISPTRPHQLLVGGSDAFARLYDRRMLSSLSSSQMKMKPPPCVNYFCPLHLSEHKKSSLHLTHVTFSPNGEEVLLSYSGEHVYLMDVKCDDDSTMRYTAADVPKYLYLAPGFEELKLTSSPACCSYRMMHRLDLYKNLVQTAANILEENSNLYLGIEACNEVLDGKGPDVGVSLRYECLCIRAALLLKMKWKNDVYMAIRDCRSALRINPSSFKAHFYMAEALMQLGKLKEAFEFAKMAVNLAPSNCEAADMVATIKIHLAAAEAEKGKKDTEETARSEIRHGRLRSLSDVLFRAELNNTHLESRYEREHSDYEEEMELDFETAISGDEPEITIDMKRRYIGHCNVGTDIKQASFLGGQGEFVASGSDDGRWFIWEKKSGRLVKMLAGDESVVNCIQCHPFDCAIATSGIDYTIKMWTPHALVPSMVAGGAAGPEPDIFSAIEMNQREICRSREVLLPLEFLERIRMHELAEGTLHPFECAQS
ncbi:protein ALTERED SEED GERMINATION 2-like isoform X2 [Zingiber officinale]|uniref:protein ALTERED SEED GERMINATION 2-like isoform X2 n=1 Tax=Zingiber officinale TaxID=94328 RepID=UPI001C4BF368|nr:protein ALTERED SEED GERMINATION 2-like isoform X2 [Zingiber officinale]